MILAGGGCFLLYCRKHQFFRIAHTAGSGAEFVHNEAYNSCTISDGSS